MKVEEIFSEELRLIKNDTIREFTKKCFEELCPNYFWDCAASSSGKYHPPFALGKGGTVRHTKVAVWWGIELSRMYGMENDQDLIVSALIMHDMKKFGDNYDGTTSSLPKDNTNVHGVSLAMEIANKMFGKEGIPQEIKYILRGIATHMGKWTKPAEFCPEEQQDEDLKRFCMLTHTADYCASRKVPPYVQSIMDTKA